MQALVRELTRALEKSNLSWAKFSNITICYNAHNALPDTLHYIPFPQPRKLNVFIWLTAAMCYILSHEMMHVCMSTPYVFTWHKCTTCTVGVSQYVCFMCYVYQSFSGGSDFTRKWRQNFKSIRCGKVLKTCAVGMFWKHALWEGSDAAAFPQCCAEFWGDISFCHQGK